MGLRRIVMVCSLLVFVSTARLDASVSARPAKAPGLGAVATTTSANPQGREWPEWLPRALIHGRVVDAQARPLEGVEVFLVTYEQIWCSSRYAPHIVVGNWNARGWRVKTEADGSYHFSVPVPEADDLYLYVRASIHHTVASHKLSLAEDADLPPLLAGGNRIPTIELGPAGAIVGLVLDDRRAPVVGAFVWTHLAWKIGPFGGSKAAPDGRYLLAHLPPGKAHISLEGRGFISPRDSSELVVVAGQSLTGPTFELKRALPLGGVVVDTDGRPVGNLLLSCHPIYGGRLFETRTDRGGRFQFFVEQPGFHLLSLGPDSTYRSSSENEESWRFESSDEDIRLVVELVPRMTIRVVDDATGEPIERYNVWTGYNNTVDTQGYRAPRRAEGLAQVDMDPARRDGVWIEAPGYAPFFGQLSELAASDDSVPTIRLLPGATITGRVVLDGEPVENAQVVIDLAVLGADGEVLTDPSLDEYYEVRGNVRERAWRGIVRRTDSRGRFSIGSLRAGVYRLGIYAEEQAPLIVDEARVATGAELELGDLTLSEGCTLHVELKLGAGISAVGIHYWTDQSSSEIMMEPLHGMFRDKRGTIETEDGRFTIHGLPAGRTDLRISPDRARLLDAVEREVVLVEGEPNHLLIDLSAQRPAKVEVRFTANLPVPRARVMLVAVDEQGRMQPSVQPQSVPLDKGQGVGHVRSDLLHIATAVNEHFVLGKSAPFRIDPKAEVTSIEIDAWLGELQLRFPDDYDITDEAAFGVLLRREGSNPPSDDIWNNTTWNWSDAELFHGFARVRGETLLDEFSFDEILWAGQDVMLGALEEGRYEFSLSAGRLDSQEGPDFIEYDWIEIRTGKVTVVEIGD